MFSNRLLVALAVSLALMLLSGCGPAAEPEVAVSTREVEKVVTEVVEVEREVERVVTQVVEKEVEVAVQTTAAPEPVAAGASDMASPSRPRAERMIIKNAETELLVSDTDVVRG
jgi:hypothetical protein